ncbi:hypothetical protein, partial [Asticcacaulis biprosthecium]|uniref:hypothetical protein n=1 Tax=Asticcacaulis biprosthecium TaxID=76891 RepID=UPI001B7F823A
MTFIPFAFNEKIGQPRLTSGNEKIGQPGLTVGNEKKRPTMNAGRCSGKTRIRFIPTPKKTDTSCKIRR